MPNAETPEAKEGQEEQPKYITADEMNAAVNSAVTNHLKRFGEKQSKELQATIKEAIASMQAPKPEPEKSDSKKADPEKNAWESKYKELSDKFEASERARQAAENKARDDKAFADLRNELSKKVRPELLDLAAENLFYVKKRVSFDEDGNRLFTIDDKQMPFEDGVAQFLKSKEAAVFLPPPDPKVAPARGGFAPRRDASGGAPRVPQTEDEKLELAWEQERAALARR